MKSRKSAQKRRGQARVAACEKERVVAGRDTGRELKDQKELRISSSV